MYSFVAEKNGLLHPVFGFALNHAKTKFFFFKNAKVFRSYMCVVLFFFCFSQFSFFLKFEDEFF